MSLLYKNLLKVFLFAACIEISLFAQMKLAHSQSSADDSYWGDTFARPERSVAVDANSADNVVYAGVFRIPHSPVIGGSDEDKYLLSIWKQDHWEFTGQVKQIYDYSGNPYITDFQVIRTVAVDQNSIYIGGNFQIITMQGDTCFNIAQWYGDQWHPVEKGIDGTVETIAPTGNGDVYVGGLFYYLKNGTLVNNIAHWNGTAWSTLDDNGGAVGVNDQVNDISVGSSSIYVAGNFSTAGGQNVNYIAGWNWGTHAWKALAGGVNNYVRSVATYGNDVYIGGDFTETIGHTSIPHIAKYTDTNSPGDAWSVVGSGNVNSVLDVEISPAGNVYAVGDFSNEADNNASAFAMWDGVQWKAFPEVDNSALNLSASGTNIAVISELTNDKVFMGFIGYNMYTTDGKILENYGMWDGNHWHGMGYGIGTFFNDSHPGKLNNIINDFAWDGSNLYAGGGFQYLGDDSVNYLAKWDPVNLMWSQLGTSGISSPGAVYALMYHNNSLYIAGDFATADGIAVNNIVKWDGNSFVALGNGLSHPTYNSIVYDIAFVHDTLFAIGEEFFNTEDNIAYFDGSMWHPFTKIPVVSYGYSKAVAYYKNNLYVMSGQNGSAYVYKYDSSLDNWIQIASSINSNPSYYELYADENYLYLGGHFSQIDNLTCNDVARWDGNSWSALGAGFSGPVYDIYTNGNDIFAGGDFVYSGNDTLYSVAQWNGTKWSALGSGVRRNPIAFNGGTATVTAMTGTPRGLYVGGTFNYAGSKYSNNLALWNNFTYTGIEDAAVSERQYQMHLFQNYPNPFNPETIIRFSVPKANLVTIKVYDILGREVATLVNEEKSKGTYQVAFNASKLSSGVYFYTMRTGDFVQTKKLVLMK